MKIIKKNLKEQKIDDFLLACNNNFNKMLECAKMNCKKEDRILTLQEVFDFNRQKVLSSKKEEQKIFITREYIEQEIFFQQKSIT